MTTFQIRGVEFTSHVEDGIYVWRSYCGRLVAGHAYADREGTMMSRRYYWAEVNGRRGTFPHTRLVDAMAAAVGQCRRGADASAGEDARSDRPAVARIGAASRQTRGACYLCSRRRRRPPVTTATFPKGAGAVMA